jgi:hypothetical protein
MKTNTIDPKYLHGGGEGWMEEQESDTPQTDAAFGQGKHGVMKIPYETSCKLEQELAASKAEVEEIRAALGDDGRRTHKEILEMAFKASGWKRWKEKYIDLRNAHIAEGQDPAGTIWEHADKLQKQLKRAVEIAEKIWADCSNGSEHTELAALKGEIK